MRDNSGVTIVEVILCVLILAIVGLAAAPWLGNALKEKKLNGAVTEVVSAIQYVQSLAISRQKVFGIYFNSSSNKITCYENDGYIMLTPVMTTLLNPLTKKDYEWNFDDSTSFQGLDIIMANFGGEEWLEFDSQGIPVDMSGDPLVLSGALIIGYADMQGKIGVDAVTGNISYSN